MFSLSFIAAAAKAEVCVLKDSTYHDIYTTLATRLLYAYHDWAFSSGKMYSVYVLGVNDNTWYPVYTTPLPADWFREAVGLYLDGIIIDSWIINREEYKHV